MAEKTLSRRRVIQIIGAAGLGAALPLGALASEKMMTTWSGISLGADADIQLFHPDKMKAKALMHACLAEITRLEKLFSLYQDGSVIRVLNANGIVRNPPHEFTNLLARAQHYSQLTDGAFDVTVQPLWDDAKASHLVGYKDLRVEENAILFAKPNMQITLNGIAQGYITDKVVALLKRGGVENSLVNLGEKYAIGSHPSGRNWRIGIDGKAGILALRNQAIATSSNQHTQHIWNPKTGEAAQGRDVSVIAGNATEADALSTACIVMNARQKATLTNQLNGLRII